VTRGLATLGLAMMLLMAGCGNPAGVDGDLTDGWAAIGAPTGFTPAAETCHLANFSSFGPRATYEEVDCGLKHRTETVYVGTYRSPAAEAADPPAPGSAGVRTAYRVCDLKTTAYVGGAWRTARLWIGVIQPTRAAWRGGARWFRCEVLVSSSIEDDGGLEQRVGTLRNELTKPRSPLLLTCYRVRLDPNGKIGTMPATSCAARHNAEFVGVWNAGDLDYPETAPQWDRFHDACRGLIASYVGVPHDADLQFRAGVISLPGGEDVWQLGDRGVRCYLWQDRATRTASLEGRGPTAMPVQYQ
jgi:hypothetical protein